jgi:hypothetical protein
MRWFVIFLVVANLLLYLWVRYESLPPAAGDIPPPEIGQLRLLHEPAEKQLDAASSAPMEAATGVGDSELEKVAQPVAPESTPAPLSTSSTVVSGAGDSAALSAVEATEPSQSQAPTVVQPENEPLSSTPSPETAVLPDDSEAGETPETALAPSIVARCARVGPLLPKDAEDLLASLPASLELVSETTEEVATADGYYVLVPPLPDRAAGLRMLDELAAAGFSDTWLFRQGEYRNAISLGLFSRETSADRHADNVAEKGFDVEVRARKTTSERRWLLLRLPRDDSFPNGVSMPDGVEVSKSTCPR